jgi:hypothetical protein
MRIAAVCTAPIAAELTPPPIKEVPRAQPMTIPLEEPRDIDDVMTDTVDELLILLEFVIFSFSWLGIEKNFVKRLF